MQKTVRITAVNVRQTKKGDIFETVCDDNQEYATFNRPLANEAQNLIGKLVLLGYSEKQNGQWTNRYLESVEVTQDNGLFPPVEEYPSQLPTSAAQPDREVRIMRQSACKIAVGLLPYLPSTEQTPQGLLVMAEFLVGYFTEGVVPGPQPFAGESAPAHTDDDIPF